MPFLLVIVGFIGAALVAVLDVTSVNWLWYAVPLLIGFTGVFWHRHQINAHASDATRVAGNLSTLENALTVLVNRLQSLNDQRDSLKVDEFRHAIDRELRTELHNFAESRHAMQQAFGLQGYADVMSAFASAERYVNRVWSASSDGYIDEVMTYLERALQQLADAREQFNQLKADR